jgi:tetrahydromethanopterin S-methyltransferase subunit F
VKENKTPPKKRAQTKVREGMGMFDKALFLAKYRGQKKQTAGEKEKKKLEAKLSPEVEANMKRVNDLKDNVDALGRDKRTQHSTSSTGGGKKGTLKLITPQRKKLQRELLANEKKQKEKEKKEKKVKPKVKPKKSKFPKFGIKAEENQFGAWGQRGLGDGNGTGSIQGSGDTHLISPVKQKELDKLMAGARYMPRSVKRRKD